MQERFHQISIEQYIRRQEQNDSRYISPRLQMKLDRHRPLIDRAVRIVSVAKNVPEGKIYSESRESEVAWARHEIAYLIYNTRTEPPASYKLIALGLNRNDHTTARNSVAVVGEKREIDTDYSDYIDSLMGELSGSNLS